VLLERSRDVAFGSSLSRFFAIDDEAEAAEYLRDDELREKLLTITRAVAEQYAAGQTTSLHTIMGSKTDALKLVSSLTLFSWVSKKLYRAEPMDVYGAMSDLADQVLGVAEAEGYSRCEYTLDRLGQ
jgi:uncharacterized protein (DUF1810 family)